VNQIVGVGGADGNVLVREVGEPGNKCVMEEARMELEGLAEAIGLNIGGLVHLLLFCP
jgi:hypothetical protein